jgi:tripartite-type tricarboxylate transporter receptor subunit TctC
MKNVLALEGAEPIGNSPDEFAAQVRTEIERWAKLVAATGIKAD